MKKNSMKNKFLTLAVLATVMGGSVFMLRAEAAKVNIVAQTSGGSYRTNIDKTTVSQTIKDGAITLGNQINFGTYQQSLKTGTITQSSEGSTSRDATYRASAGATFNTDPVAWIVVKDNGSNKYTLVSTKVLDGGVVWDTAGTQNWGNLSTDALEANKNLRAYMNNTMYNRLVEGYSSTQAGLIQNSSITTYKATSGDLGYNGWDNNSTVLSTSMDKLYLMSVQELKEYFNPAEVGSSTTDYHISTSATGKVPWGAGATDYAKSKGIWIERTGGVTAVDGSLNAYYFLRSPSSLNANFVRFSHTDGAVFNSIAATTDCGARPALQINLSSLIFTSKSLYDATTDPTSPKYTKGKGSAELGGAAAKFETISAGSAGTPGDVLDLTLYDSSLGVPNVTTNSTLELSEANMKLGYSGASTTYKTAGMLATGDATSGYAPEGWALLSNKTGTGDMVVGLANMDADTNYQLLMFNEQGDGTSFIGDAAYAFDGFKKNSGGKFELDLTTTNNAGKTFSGAITVGTGNKLTAKVSQLTGGSTITSTNDGTIVLKDNGTIAMNITNSGTVEFAAGAGNTITVSGKVIGGTVNVTSGMMKYTNPSTTDKIGSVLNISSGAALDPDAGTLADSTTNNGDLYLSGGTLSVDIGGTGTTYLKANPDAISGSTVTVNSDRNISGTLNGSSGTIKMTGDNAVKTLTIDTLTGTTNLEIDVGMSNFTADKLAVGTITGATVNVSGINITKDIVLTDNTLTLPQSGENAITYVTDSSGGTAGNATYQVGGAADGTVVATNNYKYTFSKGIENGKLNYRVDASDLTFKKFMEGTLGSPSPTTLSLTGDLLNLGDGIASISQGPNSITINLNGYNLSSASASNITVGSGKTLNLKGGSASTDGTVDAKTGFSVAGTMNISGKTTINGNITNTGTVTFADTTTAAGTLGGTGAYTNSGTMMVEDASKLQMTNGLENTGTLNLGNSSNSVLGANITGTGTTLVAGNVTNNDKTITQNILNITGSFTTDASKLNIAEAINNSGNVTFNGGTLGQKVQGAGNLSFTGNVTANADNIATTGTNEVTAGSTLNFAGGTLRKNITGAGTTEFNSTIVAAEGVHLGTATNKVNGTMEVPGHITASSINFKNGSTLKVDGNQIIGTAAINVSTSAIVESGAKLYVSNAVKDMAYKILAGSGISVSGWQTDAEMGAGFKAAYGLKVDTSGIINDGSQFTIRFVKDATAIDNIDIGNLLDNASPGSALYKYVDTLSQVQADRATQATVINTMASMNSLANVQQGTQMVTAMATDAIQSNIGAGARPILGDRGQVSGNRSGNSHQPTGMSQQGSEVRNVSADAKDSAAIEVVETGKADEVMPSAVVTEKQVYDKTVWANFIHSKKTISGLETGSLEQNSTIQFNGVTLGADLWSHYRGFGGLALTTAEGKIHSGQSGASVKNETDYQGVSLYNRYDYKGLAFLMDLTYTHAKNDVTMSTAVGADVTAKPEADAYSVGLKIEKPVKIGHSTQLTPYTGARYTHIHTDDYENSVGINNDIKDQDIVSVPVGLQLKSEMETERGWKFGHILEGGYVWNFGDRQSEQRLGYQGIYDSIDFDVTGRGEYFLKTALTASHKDTDFELGYRFTRGDNEKDNKWNFNMNYNFGNSKGLPYKSVLLGKIDLLESANKELRAENVELKAENVQLKAEVERKDLKIAELEALLKNK